MRSRPAFLFIALIFCAGLRAAPAPIPEAEAWQLPKPARLAEITRAAAPDQWAQAVPVLRAAARSAYERDKLGAAAGWLNAARWAMLFTQTEAEFIPVWIKSIESARVGHANMPSRFEMTPRPLGRWLSPELQGWLVGNAAFSEEFFTLLAPQDYVPAVFQILNSLHHADPVKFARYSSLALAIAAVYDVAPPPWWPHAQVSSSSLPRKLPAPADAFAWWTKEDVAGRTFHRLTRLPADELKFVVDAAAPFAELTWSQQIADYPLAQLDKAYTMIRYRQDRIANNNPVWPGAAAYSMHFILRDGGICVDQAYFATETGKARGVPTLLFYGTGNDGRHAWFGFLDGAQKWQFDAGRYAEQRFVTGHALDPQTWREISDHELKFLAARFRTLPTFRQSQTHAAFAADYLATNNTAAAAAAARKAVTLERRNVAAWELLLVIEESTGRTVRQRETTLREAALALQLYPDLEAGFSKRVSASLRARGEITAADAEELSIVRRNQSKRGDLSTQQAKDILLRSLATDKSPAQTLAYNSVIDRFGRGAGIGFFDEVVVTFVRHLMRTGEKAGAERAITRARQVLKVEPNSQLENEFARLLSSVRGK